MYYTFTSTFLPKEVKQTMSFEEQSERNDCRIYNLTISFEEDVNEFRKTSEDQKYEFRSKPHADSTKNNSEEDFSDKTKYSNKQKIFTKHLVNTNSTNCIIKDLNKNEAIKIAYKMTENKVTLEKDKTQRNVTSRSANTLFLLIRILKSVPMFVNQWMMIFVLLSCVCALKEQRFAIEPQDQVSFKIFIIAKGRREISLHLKWCHKYLTPIFIILVQVISCYNLLRCEARI